MDRNIHHQEHLVTGNLPSDVSMSESSKFLFCGSSLALTSTELGVFFVCHFFTSSVILYFEPPKSNLRVNDNCNVTYLNLIYHNSVESSLNGSLPSNFTLYGERGDNILTQPRPWLQITIY